MTRSWPSRELWIELEGLCLPKKQDVLGGQHPRPHCIASARMGLMLHLTPVWAYFPLSSSTLASLEATPLSMEMEWSGHGSYCHNCMINCPVRAASPSPFKCIGLGGMVVKLPHEYCPMIHRKSREYSYARYT